MSAVSRSLVVTSLCCVFGGLSAGAFAAEETEDGNPLATIPLRHIGPAITSGRISDFAFLPGGDHEFYVGTASGNLWKTDNGAITWTPVFENEGSYAIGHVVLDPNDPKTVWVGTGENNAQRSVAFGDGIYKSIDGGTSWQNMGLKNSGHISQIWINPENSAEIIVAAQGPLWNDGGDRGLYKSTDDGTTWALILEIDANTGINEFVVDPRNADVIVASSYQRRRHVWTLINGGPGSGIHKTTDGGTNWQKITSGLPEDHMGRIGLAGAPSNPDMIYAIIEANDEEKGVYRSLDFGNNWTKRSSHITTSPQYYNEIVVDPHNPERLYSLDTFTNMSEDGGETFTPLSNEWRHVDDHALWIDPENTKHLYIGGDGGIYESWDRGNTWRHVRNLSIAQFYRIQPDNDEPFYNVCGGTQDNNSVCAPSRTTVVHGISNSDWITVLSGDGYEPQFDPNDPNIIYAQYQYGGLVRYDRRTLERVAITPRPQSGENNYKWNWNTPLLISPHHPTRLYYAAEYLFRSDDRGDSWRKVSPDLTRQLDRNQLEVMGRIWGIDTIAKNDSTSIYGSAIGLSESPLQEGLIFVGTDDGLINITEDGGANWRRIDKFSGVPDMSYVEDVLASAHDADVAYAVIDNHKRGDYKPYVLKTINRGRSWNLISGNLPARGSAHTIVEDHVDPDLLFVGTEFGLFVTQDGGENWSQLKNNFPTISVRDIEIQRRENDVVVGTFGRGIYILDDYSALRTKQSALADEQLFPVRDAWLYVEGDLWDGREKGSMGAEFFTAPNPPLGVAFTYYLKNGVKSQQALRREREIEIEKAGGDTPYPEWDTVRAEENEEDPAFYLMVRNAEGKLVRQVAGDAEEGLHRSAWDLRLPPPDPVSLAEEGDRPYWEPPPAGPLVLPGEYTVRLAVQKDGVLEEVGASQGFTVKSLEASPEISDDRRALQAFHIKAANLQRAVTGTVSAITELEARIAHVRAAIVQTPNVSEAERTVLREIAARLVLISVAINGDAVVASRNEQAPMSVASRTGTLYSGLVFSQSPVAASYMESYQIAANEFSAALSSLRLLEADLSALESSLEVKGAPWTPGRIPEWSVD
jgi:photosystem II stability/assembly factor-like uncharacterized protein